MMRTIPVGDWKEKRKRSMGLSAEGGVFYPDQIAVWVLFANQSLRAFEGQAVGANEGGSLFAVSHQSRDVDRVGGRGQVFHK